MTTIDDIRENFELLEDWDDRYRYVIELGRTLEPMPEAEHSTANKVQGCASQVWLSKKVERSNTGEVLLKYLGDSDAQGKSHPKGTHRGDPRCGLQPRWSPDCFRCP